MHFADLDCTTEIYSKMEIVLSPSLIQYNMFTGHMKRNHFLCSKLCQCHSIYTIVYHRNNNKNHQFI